MMDNYKCASKLKINNFVFMNESRYTPQEAKNWFLGIFFKNSGGFCSMKEVVFQIFNLNSLFRGVKTIFWAKVISEVWSSLKWMVLNYRTECMLSCISQSDILAEELGRYNQTFFLQTRPIGNCYRKFTLNNVIFF